ncbi:cytochrome ubiquinol oxidase subunit I [Nonomuraea roseoviolacea subsp. roseoviolacea]|uniref:Cytochrome d ubiquinol oxidase subunit I n=1 Tax=Nonomuraea roseoviolacea subsp. carminata TaxID=160689 RepID=A0ABT1K7P8_9ACTN|nr:cytochrome ubiquinol oxidase subunit I [Nonomuraea roseoviolacea]MCP2350023.1 cytochrome d ubiquinol oxidase subunit I [Nonomuraea roseoviolacea subsp. carminata]
MDALDLARWQFGVTTVYHFLFVPLTIGLGVFVAGLQTAWHRTGKEHYLRLTKFFGKLFLINFAMGVVTGIVQEFQFGMNWSEYSTFVGDVFGAPLAMEALLAFFMESTFLGLWIFGWDRLPKRVHLACIWAAAIGSNLSAYFILAANAWMKHPVGYEVVDGRARMTDLWAVLTNSTALAQVPHVIGAAFIVAGGFVLAVSCWWLLRTRDGMWRGAARAALVMTAVAGLVVAGSGDLSGKLAYQQQPMKLASAEGLERDTAGAGFTLVPGIEIPKVLSFLSTGDLDATVQGTEDIQRRLEERFGPGDYRPDQNVVFWSYRVMLSFGLSTVGLSVLGLWLTRRRRPMPRFLARLFVLALPLPLLAVIAGWLLSEVGRQPWTVAGELLTAASVSPGVSLTEVALSLTLFTLLYGGLAVAEAVLLVRHVRRGPEEPAPAEVPAERREPSLMY